MMATSPFKLLLSLLAALVVLARAYAQAPVTVAAASDLKFALEEVAAHYAKAGGALPRLVFGSSGQFKTQILQGAPFQLFLSADEAYIDDLVQAGKTVDRGRIYAVGRIGIFVPKASTLKPDGELKDLAAALQDGRLQKFAIANPDHAPYGARAREALQRAGLWQAIGPRLVMGENIAQTAQFASSGAAQGGIIASSLARAPALAQAGRFELIPQDWHSPLRQRMVLIKGASQEAAAFYAHLSTAAAQAVLMRHGFTIPKE